MVVPQRRKNNSAKWHNSSLSLSGVNPIPKMMANVYNHWRVLHVNLTSLGPFPLHCSTKYSRINLRNRCWPLKCHIKSTIPRKWEEPHGPKCGSTCPPWLSAHQVLLLGSSYHNCKEVLLWRIPESISVSLFRLWAPECEAWPIVIFDHCIISRA